MNSKDRFSAIKIRIASPEKIREWSHGEVKKPETINYRTLRPERDGLFCEKIFGTTKEYECYCGKFKSIRYKGVVCDRCGVEVTHFKVRRERMGHIELACPVSHIWYYRTGPSRIGRLLDLTKNKLRSILYYENYIVIDPGDTKLKKMQLLSEDDFLEVKELYGDDKFKAEMGAGTIQELLSGLDLEALSKELEEIVDKNPTKMDKKEAKRLKVVKAFLNSENKPEWMILDVVPVIPPELRPMVQLEGGRFATSDLNDLYRRVINRNNRLQRLLVLKAPEIIIRNEKRMLQEAVDSLFDNSRGKRMAKGSGNRALKSLSDILQGKQGRFRQNLLGKRVDYSGRSVIIVGPKLKLHQCGIPKEMALELFKPFIMKKLVDMDAAQNIKNAKKLIETQHKSVWPALESVTKSHPVLLNRAPTLHRLGIQAFEPVLVEGRAITIHPMVCKAFNADFDGDQMAIHLPLSDAAQVEAWLYMLSVNNLLSPANGKPVVGPTQDMVLGISYLTKDKINGKGEGMQFSSINEAVKAWESDELELQSIIKVLIEKHEKDENGKEIITIELIETTLGRLFFREILPSDYEYKDQFQTEKTLKELVHDVLQKYGHSRTVELLDAMKDLGYKYATYFSPTIGMDDIKVSDKKYKLIEKAEKEVVKIERDFNEGIMTSKERYNRVIDIWNKVNDDVANEMYRALAEDRDGQNPIYMMSASGARGSKQQIRQLNGMRGLMAKPDGSIIELPIKSNFREGLNVLEYYISTHGARKGLADTALKTADAGYLTRRLVDIAQEVFITDYDCGTTEGKRVKKITRGEKVVATLAERILGRVSVYDIYDPQTNEIIIKRNEEITEQIAEKIDMVGIEEVTIRSVLKCKMHQGVCALCYGRNLANGKLVEIGEAVGVIAAQSIGEPGTQLTMRTFHIGGIAHTQKEESFLQAGKDCIIISAPKRVVKNPKNQLVTTRKDYFVIQAVLYREKLDKFKDILLQHRQKIHRADSIGILKNNNKFNPKIEGIIHISNGYINILHLDQNIINVRIGSIIKIKEGDFVKSSDEMASFDPFMSPIISEIAGTVRFSGIISGQTMKILSGKKGKKEQKMIVEHNDKEVQPIIIIKGEKEMTHMLPVGATLAVEDGQQIKEGEVLARIPRETAKQSDITGGLPRVADLFEARKTIDACTLSEVDGEVEIGETLKGKMTVIVHSNDGVDKKYKIPVKKQLRVHDGDYIRRGEAIDKGPYNPHEYLRIRGEDALQDYLINEIQEVYRLQGVGINDKHIETIIRQMLLKREITARGNTDFVVGDFVDKFELERENQRVIEEGGEPASGVVILQGLTKAALNTASFISDASFQQTTRVLTNAAIEGRIDRLVGLKENVIIGHKVPIGTGMKRNQQVRVESRAVYDIKMDDFDDRVQQEVEEEALKKDVFNK